MGTEEILDYNQRLDRLMVQLDASMEDFIVLADERSRLNALIKGRCIDFMEKSVEDLRRVKMDKVEAWACAAEPYRSDLLKRDTVAAAYDKVSKAIEIMQAKISAIQSEMKYYNPR